MSAMASKRRQKAHVTYADTRADFGPSRLAQTSAERTSRALEDTYHKELANLDCTFQQRLSTARSTVERDSARKEYDFQVDIVNRLHNVETGVLAPGSFGTGHVCGDDARHVCGDVMRANDRSGASLEPSLNSGSGGTWNTTGSPMPWGFTSAETPKVWTSKEGEQTPRRAREGERPQRRLNLSSLEGSPPHVSIQSAFFGSPQPVPNQSSILPSPPHSPNQSGLMPVTPPAQIRPARLPSPPPAQNQPVRFPSPPPAQKRPSSPPVQPMQGTPPMHHQQAFPRSPQPGPSHGTTPESFNTTPSGASHPFTMPSSWADSPTTGGVNPWIAMSLVPTVREEVKVRTIQQRVDITPCMCKFTVLANYYMFKYFNEIVGEERYYRFTYGNLIERDETNRDRITAQMEAAIKRAKFQKQTDLLRFLYHMYHDVVDRCREKKIRIIERRVERPEGGTETHTIEDDPTDSEPQPEIDFNFVQGTIGHGVYLLIEKQRLALYQLRHDNVEYSHSIEDSAEADLISGRHRALYMEFQRNCVAEFAEVIDAAARNFEETEANRMMQSVLIGFQMRCRDERRAIEGGQDVRSHHERQKTEARHRAEEEMLDASLPNFAAVVQVAAGEWSHAFRPQFASTPNMFEESFEFEPKIYSTPAQPGEPAEPLLAAFQALAATSRRNVSTETEGQVAQQSAQSSGMSGVSRMHGTTMDSNAELSEMVHIRGWTPLSLSGLLSSSCESDSLEQSNNVQVCGMRPGPVFFREGSPDMPPALPPSSPRRAGLPVVRPQRPGSPNLSAIPTTMPPTSIERRPTGRPPVVRPVGLQGIPTARSPQHSPMARTPHQSPARMGSPARPGTPDTFGSKQSSWMSGSFGTPSSKKWTGDKSYGSEGSTSYSQVFEQGPAPWGQFSSRVSSPRGASGSPRDPAAGSPQETHVEQRWLQNQSQASVAANHVANSADFPSTGIQDQSPRGKPLSPEVLVSHYNTTLSSEGSSLAPTPQRPRGKPLSPEVLVSHYNTTLSSEGPSLAPTPQPPRGKPLSPKVLVSHYNTTLSSEGPSLAPTPQPPRGKPLSPKVLVSHYNTTLSSEGSSLAPTPQQSPARMESPARPGTPATFGSTQSSEGSTFYSQDSQQGQFSSRASSPRGAGGSPRDLAAGSPQTSGSGASGWWTEGSSQGAASPAPGTPGRAGSPRGEAATPVRAGSPQVPADLTACLNNFHCYAELAARDIVRIEKLLEDDVIKEFDAIMAAHAPIEKEELLRHFDTVMEALRLHNEKHVNEMYDQLLNMYQVLMQDCEKYASSPRGAGGSPRDPAAGSPQTSGSEASGWWTEGSSQGTASPAPGTPGRAGSPRGEAATPVRAGSPQVPADLTACLNIFHCYAELAARGIVRIEKFLEDDVIKEFDAIMAAHAPIEKEELLRHFDTVMEGLRLHNEKHVNEMYDQLLNIYQVFMQDCEKYAFNLNDSMLQMDKKNGSAIGRLIAMHLAESNHQNLAHGSPALIRTKYQRWLRQLLDKMHLNQNEKQVVVTEEVIEDGQVVQHRQETHVEQNEPPRNPVAEDAENVILEQVRQNQALEAEQNQQAEQLPYTNEMRRDHIAQRRLQNQSQASEAANHVANSADFLSTDIQGQPPRGKPLSPEVLVRHYTTQPSGVSSLAPTSLQPMEDRHRKPFTPPSSRPPTSPTSLPSPLPSQIPDPQMMSTPERSLVRPQQLSFPAPDAPEAKPQPREVAADRSPCDCTCQTTVDDPDAETDDCFCMCERMLPTLQNLREMESSEQCEMFRSLRRWQIARRDIIASMGRQKKADNSGLC